MWSTLLLPVREAHGIQLKNIKHLKYIMQSHRESERHAALWTFRINYHCVESGIELKYIQLEH